MGRGVSKRGGGKEQTEDACSKRKRRFEGEKGNERKEEWINGERGEGAEGVGGRRNKEQRIQGRAEHPYPLLRVSLFTQSKRSGEGRVQYELDEGAEFPWQGSCKDTYRSLKLCCTASYSTHVLSMHCSQRVYVCVCVCVVVEMEMENGMPVVICVEEGGGREQHPYLCEG